MAVWDQFVQYGHSVQLLLKRSKSFCNLASSLITTGNFRSWICNHDIYRKSKLSRHDQTEQPNPSWHAQYLEHHLSTNPIYHQSFGPLCLFPTPIISAEAPCYRLFSKPGAREVSLILVLLCWANKTGKGINPKREKRHLQICLWWEQMRKRLGRQRQCKAADTIIALGATVGWSFTLEGLLEFLFSQSSWHRGFPVLQLMAKKEKKFSENVWTYMTPWMCLQTLTWTSTHQRLLPWLLEIAHVLKKQNTALLTQSRLVQVSQLLPIPFLSCF